MAAAAVAYPSPSAAVWPGSVWVVHGVAAQLLDVSLQVDPERAARVLQGLPRINSTRSLIPNPFTPPPQFTWVSLFPPRYQVAVAVVLPSATMQNEEGKMVDLYVPRKCSATNRIITAKDHASVQINIGHLDENGLYNGQFTTFALSGFVRAQGDADGSLDRLWQKRKAEIKQ
ncbi:hypothetical protein EJB05_06650, partial [Eragrostis curvula]